MKIEKKKSNNAFMRVVRLFLSMLKIGVIGFGGGSALIPVIEREVVEEQKIVSKEEYDKSVVVACITPGALPVEISCGVGRSISRSTMVFASMCMALPGAVFTVLLLSVFSKISGSVMTQIEIATLGIIPFILYLLINYISSVCKEAKQESKKRLGKVVFIMTCVFILTGVKNIFKLLDLDITPPLELSTAPLLGLVCFIVLWSQGNYKIKNLIIPLAIVGAYLGIDTAANLGLEWECIGYVKLALGIVMALLTLIKVWMSFTEKSEKSRKTTKKSKIADKAQFTDDKKGSVLWLDLLKEISGWFVLVILLCTPALIKLAGSADYLLKGAASSFLSFGGGDAYLTIAEDLFHNTGLLSDNEFFGTLISVANILPGSILCKILTGAGYIIGSHNGGGVLNGYLMALAGFGCSVACSGLVFSAVLFLYNKFEKLTVFQLLKRWIRPVIAGLLINIMISLINQIKKTGIALEFSWVIVVALAVVILFLNVFLSYRKSPSNVILILMSLGVAFLAGNLVLIV